MKRCKGKYGEDGERWVSSELRCVEARLVFTLSGPLRRQMRDIDRLLWRRWATRKADRDGGAVGLSHAFSALSARGLHLGDTVAWMHRPVLGGQGLAVNFHQHEDQLHVLMACDAGGSERRGRRARAGGRGLPRRRGGRQEIGETGGGGLAAAAGALSRGSRRR